MEGTVIWGSFQARLVCSASNRTSDHVPCPALRGNGRQPSRFRRRPSTSESQLNGLPVQWVIRSSRVCERFRGVPLSSIFPSSWMNGAEESSRHLSGIQLFPWGRQWLARPATPLIWWVAAWRLLAKLTIHAKSLCDNFFSSCVLM